MLVYEDREEQAVVNLNIEFSVSVVSNMQADNQK